MMAVIEEAAKFCQQRNLLRRKRDDVQLTLGALVVVLWGLKNVIHFTCLSISRRDNLLWLKQGAQIGGGAKAQAGKVRSRK